MSESPDICSFLHHLNPLRQIDTVFVIHVAKDKNRTWTIRTYHGDRRKKRLIQQVNATDLDRLTAIQIGRSLYTEKLRAGYKDITSAEYGQGQPRGNIATVEAIQAKIFDMANDLTTPMSQLATVNREPVNRIHPSRANRRHII